VLKLLRAFLNAGVMEYGLVSALDEGTPQGGTPYGGCDRESSREPTYVDL
jgi:hypothetical protein